MDTHEAGRIGGMTTLTRYGLEHYVKAGKAKKGKKSPGSGRWGKKKNSALLSKNKGL